ncbi:protein LEO1 homolog isoform X2 [Malania oleifera]|uniref:protein LEO1 homolog isoform X2 n=1 Tax=Malania oleifera TaxID=397392 RepID=UPI0025AE336A|nr:protein LEO1 homolog isoform X2 [Malania oleifera]
MEGDSSSKKDLMKSLFGEESDEELRSLQQLQPSQGSTADNAIHAAAAAEIEKNVREKLKDAKKDAQDKGKGIMIAEPERGKKYLDASYPMNNTGDSEDNNLDYVAQNIELDNNPNLQTKKSKDKPVGPPLLIEIPRGAPPPRKPEKISLFKISNIIYFDPNPFDPETYVDENELLGTNKRINVVRWRKVINPDGTISRETNSRFVRWSDGSLQLLIGNEPLDITEQEAQELQTHVFLQIGKGLMMAQGKVKKKMIATPSSLSSNSHRSLAALVNSRSKKGPKVKPCITSVDPEWELEDMKKAMEQAAKADAVLQRKQEKVMQKHEKENDEKKKNKKKKNKKKNKKNKKYGEGGNQLSVDMLEDSASASEDVEPDYVDPRSAALRSLEDDIVKEAEVEKQKENANKEPMHETEKPAAANKGKRIALDDESPPKKIVVGHRKAIVYESDEE